MFIPCQDSVCKMSPIEFEKYALLVLSEQIKEMGNCTFQHNKIIEVDDGNYQIDGFIEFSLMGLTFKTIVECKHYKSSITREKVAVLYDKIRACGANKGVLVSSSSFQSGAITYATKHGIALIQITDKNNIYQARSLRGNIFNYITPNNSASYEGVLQYENDRGICCEHLSTTNLALKEFLMCEN